MPDRLKTALIVALVLFVLGFFMVAGALDPPNRLKERPPTATPITPTATPLRR